mgnify:CR=1 FL=1
MSTDDFDPQALLSAERLATEQRHGREDQDQPESVLDNFQPSS